MRPLGLMQPIKLWAALLQRGASVQLNFCRVAERGCNSLPEAYVSIYINNKNIKSI